VVLEIEDESFHVAEALVQHPQLVVGRGDIVQHADDEVALNGLPASSCVLKNLLAFRQQDQRFFVCSHIYLAFGLIVDAFHLINEIL
jgi:hypothetical protein